MLEIRPIQTKEEQKIICEACGMEYIPHAYCHSAEENGLIAAAQSVINGQTGRILNTGMKKGLKRDGEALFILCRAVLNFFDLCGVKHAEYPADAEEEKDLALQAGFSESEDGLRIDDISKLFETHCAERAEKKKI